MDVGLTGVGYLQLRVTDGGDGNQGDHADWADAQLEFTGVRPQAIATPVRAAVILTPKASSKPQVNGPAVFGVRPGSPFLYTIPATGTRPMTFAADGLPAGLKMESIKTNCVNKPPPWQAGVGWTSMQSRSWTARSPWGCSTARTRTKPSPRTGVT